MRLLAIVLGVFCAAPLWAAGEFEAWKQESQQQYRGYRAEQDRRFGTYLEQQWREFKVFRGERRDPAPKPVRPPAVAPAHPVQPVVVAPAPVPSAPIPAPVAPPGKAGTIAVACFGITFDLPAASLPLLKGAVDAAAISRWWKLAAEQDRGEAAAALAEVRERRHLSDWNMHLLVTSYAAAGGVNWNSRVAREWFYLTRLGYLARVAIEDGQLVLLARTDRVLYETRYLQVGGERYYLVDAPAAGSDRFTTYDGEHPAASRPFSMEQDFTAWSSLAPTQTRQLTFDHRDRRYTLSVAYNRDLVDYLNALPVTDLGVYFNTTESPALRQQLERQLRPLIAGMTEEEAVDFLLAFVQKAFAYQTDQQQFGREHYMFADETIHYPYSDCEDRAVIFARIVRELVGVPVIGVSYPGHVAAAVALRDAKGRRLEHGGVSYVIADPTYIGASVGMEMPQYAGVNPELIEIH